MVGRHVKRKQVEERPTTQMHKDELLNLLTDGEREVARRQRAKTTIQPLAITVEHTPLPVIDPPVDSTRPIEDEPFTINTREFDANVFPPPPAVAPPVEEPVPAVRESTVRKARIPLSISLIAVAFVMLLIVAGT